MKAVKTMQKYKCDFCKKRGVKHAMEIHEKRCYRNPNRFCDACQNTGVLPRDGYWNADEEEYSNDCPYCKKFNEQTLKEIIEREQGIKIKDDPQFPELNINF